MEAAPSRAELCELRNLPWQEQLKHLITTPEQLSRHVNLTREEMATIRKAAQLFPMAITPYYASLIDPDNRLCPIRMQAVPSGQELSMAAADLKDPLGEETDSPVPCLTHRYPDRVLLLVTSSCSMFCRHCTRKRRVGDRDQAVNRSRLRRAIDHIARTPAVRDVLISGGDPLMLPDGRLEWILSRLRAIKHVEVIRIGSRMPVVLPQRITAELVQVLRRFHPLWINTHFNHPRELTEESRGALARLADAGLPLGNQSVLLRDVNDCPLIMRELVHTLVKNRVRPYYLYQCDLSRGIEHFRTPISKGIEIMEMLRGHTSGFAVPTFVVDAPGGGGKIPVTPNYLLTMGPRRVILRNYEGVITVYNEPRHKETTCPPTCTYCDENLGKGQRWAPEIGLGKLLSYTNDIVALVPEGNERDERRDGPDGD